MLNNRHWVSDLLVLGLVFFLLRLSIEPTITYLENAISQGL
jgi:hypothetical protein